MMSHIDLQSSVLVDAHMASRMLNVAHSTLALWRVQKKGPPYYKIGKAIRYRLEDLNSYLDAQRVSIQ